MTSHGLHHHDNRNHTSSIDDFQINEIIIDLRTSGFDNEVFSVDACAVWWERESFYCLPRISVEPWHREPRLQCGSARTGSIWNLSIDDALTCDVTQNKTGCVRIPPRSKVISSIYSLPFLKRITTCRPIHICEHFQDFVNSYIDHLVFSPRQIHVYETEAWKSMDWHPFCCFENRHCSLIVIWHATSVFNSQQTFVWSTHNCRCERSRIGGDFSPPTPITAASSFTPCVLFTLGSSRSTSRKSRSTSRKSRPTRKLRRRWCNSVHNNV